MILNKNLGLIGQFLGDYNREIYGRGMVGKVPMSQKAIALALDNMENQSILKSRKQGNMKYFRMNLENPEVKDIIVSAEIMRKLEFFKKHRKIANLFKQDSRIVGIFGSYAKGTEKGDSDIDLFVIGSKLREDYDKKGKPYDLNISIKYFTEKGFKIKNNLIKEIAASHIIIFGIEKFTDMLWRDFYGFN